MRVVCPPWLPGRRGQCDAIVATVRINICLRKEGLKRTVVSRAEWSRARFGVEEKDEDV